MYSPIEKKIEEIRNFIYSIQYEFEYIDNIIEKILDFLQKYHDDDYHSPTFNPLIKNINFKYFYDSDTATLYFKYAITRRKWINISFEPV